MDSNIVAMKIGSQYDLERDATAEDYWLAALRPRLVRTDAIKGHLRLQKTLWREAEAMQRAMCVLRTRCNAISPTCRLPPQVLCRIFSSCAIQEPPVSETLGSLSITSSALGWIKVTHVCSHWRETALHEPNLWANVTYCLGLHWSRLMLSRSRTAPVSVSSIDCEHFDKELSDHFFHLSHLDLRFSDKLLTRGVAYWDAPAPLLESLHLSKRSRLVSLPGHAFGDYTPLLRRVVLCDVYLPYNSPVFASLTHLELRWYPDYYQSGHLSAFLRANRSSFQTPCLLSSLARMPALRTLILDTCLPSPAQGLRSIPVVKLAHLETLKLMGTSARCAGIMDHLEFPQACTLYLKLLRCNEPEELQGSVLPALRAHLFRKKVTASHQYVPISVLDISTEYHIKAWRYNAPMEGLAHDAHVSIPLTEPTVQIVQNAGHHIHSLHDLCNLFPLDELRVLHKNDGRRSRDARPYEWLALFGSCNAVEHVSLCGSDFLPFSIAFFNLAPKAGSDTVNTVQDLQEAPRRDHIFFPNLQSLSLCNVNSGWSREDQLYLALAKWLHIRQTMATLPQLHIIRSDITHRQVKILESVAKVNTSMAWIREDFGYADREENSNQEIEYDEVDGSGDDE